MPGVYQPVGNSPMYQISNPNGGNFTVVNVTNIQSVTSDGGAPAHAILTMTDGTTYTLDGSLNLIAITPAQAVLDVVTFWPRGSST